VTARNPSKPWKGRTPEDTQVFFQPDGSGVVELTNWRFERNDHEQLCVFHDTPPAHHKGLWGWVRVEDDRLMFVDREGLRREKDDEPTTRRSALARLFGLDD